MGEPIKISAKAVNAAREAIETVRREKYDQPPPPGYFDSDEWAAALDVGVRQARITMADLVAAGKAEFKDCKRYRKGGSTRVRYFKMKNGRKP